MNRIKLILGDPYRDGHGMHKEYIIETELTLKEINNAHKVACKRLDINWDSICSDYQDSAIDLDLAKKFNVEFESYEHEGKQSITEKDFTEMYLFLVRDETKQECRIISENIFSIDIGGYGLFYN